jgi:transcriptional regulator GlxA family with amidase domain
VDHDLNRQEMQRLAPALQMMATDYGKDLDVPQLARSCNMSESHFRRVFIKTIGKSPLAYLNNLRMRMATVLLQKGNQQIMEIAWQVGYSSLSSFNRHFKTAFGCAPRIWLQKRKAAGKSVKS